MKLEPNSPRNHGQYISDKTTMANVDSKRVYESGKGKVTLENINDWKILTVKQLRRGRKDNRSGSRGSKGSKGIELSISRSRGKSFVGERTGSVAGLQGREQ